jgi:hypothetical protein
MLPKFLHKVSSAYRRFFHVAPPTPTPTTEPSLPFLRRNKKKREMRKEEEEEEGRAPLKS